MRGFTTWARSDAETPVVALYLSFFFSSRRRHTSSLRDWSSDVCSSDLGNVGNPDIGPERTREAELGLDAALLHDRLTVEATWYHRLTTDALFSVRQPPSVGFPQDKVANVGSLSNTGIELALSGTVFSKPPWGLDLGASV